MIDGFSSVRELARDRFEIEELIDYTPRESPLQQLMATMGGAMGQTLFDAISGQGIVMR